MKKGRRYITWIMIGAILLFVFWGLKSDEPQNIPSEYHNGLKSIAIYDQADSEAEKVVLNHFLYEIQSDYENLLNTYADTERFSIEVSNTEKQEKEGYCIQKYEIYDLSSVLIESSEDYYMQEEIKRNKYDRYCMVTVEFYMEWSEIAYSQSPQYDNGTYQRDFLCGLKGEEWKICEVGGMN